MLYATPVVAVVAFRKRICQNVCKIRMKSVVMLHVIFCSCSNNFSQFKIVLVNQGSQTEALKWKITLP